MTINVHRCSFCSLPSLHKGLCKISMNNVKRNSYVKLSINKQNKKNVIERKREILKVNVGMHVSVIFPDKRWYNGIITEITQEGRSHVLYNDGDHLWRYLTKKNCHILPCKGKYIEIYWELDNAWYGGIVGDSTPNGRIRIFYDDGERHLHWMHLEKWRYVSSKVDLECAEILCMLSSVHILRELSRSY